MATGAASIANMVGLKGLGGKLAAKGGAAAIQAGLTTSATSATGAAITADLASGTVGGLSTTAGEAVALSSKATAAAATEAGVGTIGTVMEGGTISGSVEGITGTQVEQVVSTISTTGAKSSGVSSAVWGGISSGATSMLKSYFAQKATERGPTFVAGGLSHGGPSELGPQPRFVVGGSNPLRSDPIQGTAAPTQEATPPVSAGDIGPTRAGILARQGPAPAGALPSEGPASTPGELPEAVEAPLGILAQHGRSGEATMESNLEVPFQSTPIDDRRTRRRGSAFSAPILGIG